MLYIFVYTFTEQIGHWKLKPFIQNKGTGKKALESGTSCLVYDKKVCRCYNIATTNI